VFLWTQRAVGAVVDGGGSLSWRLEVVVVVVGWCRMWLWRMVMIMRAAVRSDRQGCQLWAPTVSSLCAGWCCCARQGDSMKSRTVCVCVLV
jgi:hypothetical protein